MLAGAGIFFTIKTRFVQIRLLGDCFRCMFEKKTSGKGISSFQALMIATASRVGTGNMAGVATAIVLGGPAYYIEKALHARWLGIVFAISLIVTFAFGFNGLQSHFSHDSFCIHSRMCQVKPADLLRKIMIYPAR